MSFQSVPECAEAVIQATADGKQVVNVLGFRKAGGYSSTDIQNLADAVDAAVGTEYLPVISVGVAYNGVLARGLENINDYVATSTANAGVGGVSGGALPSNVTLCITLRSALSGRSARGRFYAFPTGTSKQDTENSFVGSYGTALETFLAFVQTEAAAQGWTLSVISRRTGNAPRLVGVSFPVVTIGARNLLIDSQRGRLPAGH